MHAGIPVDVVGILDSTKSPNDPYVLCEATQDDRVIVVINMKHPASGIYRRERPTGLLPLLHLRCARRVARAPPGHNRAKHHPEAKDSFLRVRFDLDMS